MGEIASNDMPPGAARPDSPTPILSILSQLDRSVSAWGWQYV